MSLNNVAYNNDVRSNKGSASTILIADDDASIRTVLSQALARAGFQVRSTSNASTLWKWVKEQEGDLVLTDVIMPDGSVFDFLPKIRMERPKLPIIVMSAQTNLLTAVSAAEQGAFEYLPKPFDLEKMIELIKRALEPVGEHRAVVQKRKAQVDEGLPLIGRSNSMQEVYRTLSRVAPSDLTVLLEGEVGVGKKLIARTIHDYSNRKSNMFKSVNVAGFTNPFDLDQVFYGKNLIGGGMIEELRGGTVLLDGLSDTSPEVQSRILGISSDLEAADIRIIGSSHESLRNKVAAGDFRADLFHYLNVIGINVPPLRERVSDIGDLARLFLTRASRFGNGEKIIDKSAVEELEQWSWPGNVRELENLMYRLTVLNSQNLINSATVANALVDAKITPTVAAKEKDGDLQSVVKTTIGTILINAKNEGKNIHDLHSNIIRTVEKPLFEMTLKETRGNQIKAAELLGLNRNTLRKRLSDFGLN